MQAKAKKTLAGLTAAIPLLTLGWNSRHHPLAAPPPTNQIVGFTVMLRLQREGAAIIDARAKGRPIPGAVPLATMKGQQPTDRKPWVVLAEETKFHSLARRIPTTSNLYFVSAARLETHDMPGITQLTPQQVQKRRNVTILDVSEPEEFAHAHIPGSRQVNFMQLAGGERSFLPAKGRTIVLACPIGHRSQYAAQYLERDGYRVYNLRGGIIGWESAQLPLVKKAPTTPTGAP